MEVMDILFVTNYDPVNGWRFKPRRGAEYFLKKMGYPTTELVIYSEANGQDVQLLIQRYFSTHAAKTAVNAFFKKCFPNS